MTLDSPTPAACAAGGSGMPKREHKSPSAVSAEELEERLKDCFIESLRSFYGTHKSQFYLNFIRICKNRGFENPEKPDRQRIVASLVKDGRVEQIPSSSEHALKYRLPLASPPPAASTGAASVLIDPVTTGKMT